MPAFVFPLCCSGCPLNPFFVFPLTSLVLVVVAEHTSRRILGLSSPKVNANVPKNSNNAVRSSHHFNCMENISTNKEWKIHATMGTAPLLLESKVAKRPAKEINPWCQKMPQTDLLKFLRLLRLLQQYHMCSAWLPRQGKQNWCDGSCSQTMMHPTATYYITLLPVHCWLMHDVSQTSVVHLNGNAILHS